MKMNMKKFFGQNYNLSWKINLKILERSLQQYKNILMRHTIYQNTIYAKI